MLDILDVLAGRATETNPATYYPFRPDTLKHASAQNDPFGDEYYGVPIDYEIVDPMSYQLRKLFADITDRKGKMMVIKTRDQEEYKIGGYIETQDGSLYVIDAVTIDTNEASKHAMRFLPIPLESAYIIRLFEVENLKRIRGR